MSSSFLKFCHSFDKFVTRLRVAFYVTNAMCYHTRDIQTYRTTTNLSITRMITDPIELHSVLLSL